MKKNFIPIIALLTIAVASCTENIVPTEVVKPEVKLENRAIEEIIQIAQNAPSLFESKDETRGTKNVKKAPIQQVSKKLASLPGLSLLAPAVLLVALL